MARPLFKSSGSDLQKLFNKAQDDPDDLKLMLDELQFRKKPKMLRLRAQIQERLAHISKKTTYSSKVSSNSKKTSPPPPNTHQSHKTQSNPQNELNDGYDQNLNTPPASVAQIRPSGSLTDTPSKFQFEKKTYVQLSLENTTSLSPRYEIYLKALITTEKTVVLESFTDAQNTLPAKEQ